LATTKRKVVYVHWVDACSQDSWQSISSVTPLVLESHTIGYLVAENKEAISVANTVNDSNDVCCIIHIPKKWIKQRSVLKFETKQRKETNNS
jgi:hypothetical protein